MSITKQFGSAKFYNNRTIKRIAKYCEVDYILKGLAFYDNLYISVVWNIVKHDHKSAVKLLNLVAHKYDSFDEIITFVSMFVRDIRYLKRIIEIWINTSNKRYSELSANSMTDFAYCLEPMIYDELRLVKWFYDKTSIGAAKFHFAKWNLKKAIEANNIKFASYLNKKDPEIMNKVIEYSNGERWTVHSDKYKTCYTAKSNLMLEYEGDADSTSLAVTRIGRYTPYHLFNTICRHITTKNLTKLTSYYVFTL
jgi:hypothetical protein